MASLTHLAMACCVEAIAEHDLGRAAATFADCLHVLRKDVLLMCIAMDVDPMSMAMSTPDETIGAEASQ